MKTKTAIVTGLLLTSVLSANAFDITKNVRVGETVTLPQTVEYQGTNSTVDWDKKNVNTETEGIILVKGTLASGEDCNLHILVTNNPSTLSDTAHSISFSQKNLNVTAKSVGDNPYASVSVFVKDDEKALEFDRYDVTDAVAVQAEKLADGTAEFNVDLNDFPDGTYVYFVSSGETTAVGEFVYRNADSYVDAVLAANGDTLGTDLIALYDDYKIIIDLSLEDIYNSLSDEDKETVMKNMHKYVTSLENALFDDIQSAIDKETAMVMYLKSEDKKAFLENTDIDYASPLGIDTSANGYYGKLDGKDNVIKSIEKTNPKTSADLYKCFYDAVAVTAMNESVNADVYDILKDFDKVGDVEILGISDSLKKLDEKLTDSQRNDVLSKMAAVNKYSSTSEISHKLATEIASVTSSKGSGGSGGSGGGSTGKGNTTSATGASSYVSPSVGSVGSKTKFDDINDAPWAEMYINALAEKNIVNGDGDKFRPNDPVTRAEFSKILVNILDLPQSEYIIDFTDVNKTDWYAEYVNSLYTVGIINGVSETEFDPNGCLTREDMCVLVCRAKQYSDNIEIPSGNPDFADSNLISTYAVSAVAYLKEQGIVNGVGENMFMPKSVCSRAAVCKVAAQVFDIK